MSVSPAMGTNYAGNYTIPRTIREQDAFLLYLCPNKDWNMMEYFSRKDPMSNFRFRGRKQVLSTREQIHEKLILLFTVIVCIGFFVKIIFL
jgi:hypothetical protein